MGKIVVRASTLCGALAIEGAEIYIDGNFFGHSGKNGYSKAAAIDGESCSVRVEADGYEKYFVDKVNLYKNATVIWPAMLEGQTRSKNKEKA